MTNQVAERMKQTIDNVFAKLADLERRVYGLTEENKRLDAELKVRGWLAQPVVGEAMDAVRLVEIEQRLQAATPGPWEAIWDIRPDVKARIVTKDGAGGYWDSGELVNATEQPSRAHPDTVRVACFSKYERACYDAEMVAHSREDLADLLAEVKRLRALAEQYIAG